MLTKTNIADHHIRTAIKMIAHEMSDISIHVLVMAAEEMLLSIAKKQSVELPLDFANLIVPGKQKWFRDQRRASYNWFKHANRDAEEFFSSESITGIRTANELQTMANMHSLATIEDRGFTYLEGTYLSYMFVFHEELFNLDEFFKLLPELREALSSFNGMDRDRFLASLRQILSDK